MTAFNLDIDATSSVTNAFNKSCEIPFAACLQPEQCWNAEVPERSVLTSACWVLAFASIGWGILLILISESNEAIMRFLMKMKLLFKKWKSKVVDEH